ncbi:MAG: putative membrane protein [Pseudoalteromonas distincta]|jgi:putative membrane protein
MIKYNPKIWFTQILQVPKSDTLRILFPEMLILAILTAGLTYVELTFFKDLHIFKDAIAVYSLIGFVLSLLLVFRTNTAYDRWWEGRKKWGELVNNTRSLAIKVSASTQNKDILSFFNRMITNYVYVLKWHLRDGEEELNVDLSPSEKTAFDAVSHKPSYISQLMYAKLRKMKSKGEISEIDYITMDTNLNTFSNITGACERIKNTPMPYSYNLFLKKFIFVYVMTLPVGFVSSFGYGTILIAVFIFYVLVSIELLAEEIEDPFGLDDNDLPLTEISEKIKENVSDILK